MGLGESSTIVDHVKDSIIGDVGGEDEIDLHSLVEFAHGSTDRYLAAVSRSTRALARSAFVEYLLEILPQDCG